MVGFSSGPVTALEWTVLKHIIDYADGDMGKSKSSVLRESGMHSHAVEVSREGICILRKDARESRDAREEGRTIACNREQNWSEARVENMCSAGMLKDSVAGALVLHSLTRT